MSHTTPADDDIRARLREAVAHLEHVLPGQAPIKDFVHHNTLHGYQHLPFAEALRQAYERTGNDGYLPASQFRDYYRQGRISREDLLRVLDDDSELNAAETLFSAGERTFCRRDIYLAALLHPFKSVTGCQLNWQVEENTALSAFQADVAVGTRQQLLMDARAHGADSETQAVGDLWNACLQALQLEYFLLHPEELVDLSPDQVEQMEQIDSQSAVTRTREASGGVLADLLAQTGHTLTLRGVLKSLTSRDILSDLQPMLLRHLSAYLDQGVAAWHHPARQQGFYGAWRNSAGADLAWIFQDMPEWEKVIAELPADALETIISELTRLGLPEERWAGYLERLALELPGWSGMLNWRAHRPGYENLPEVKMVDYLAVRLVLERLFARRTCRDRWHIEATLPAIAAYFNANYAEFIVRYALYNTRLPEYLTSRAQHLTNRSTLNPADPTAWLHVADMICTWRRSPAADRPEGYSVYRSAWPLFRLTQHLGLCGAYVRQLTPEQVAGIFACLEQLDEQQSGFVWLQAYENHYRDQIFNAVTANQGRGRNFRNSDRRPQAQTVFCMDDREEGIRRHLEETNPDYETFGAAGFFNVPMNWQGLDDSGITPLCPVVVVPAHEVREQLQDTVPSARHRQHQQRRRLRLWAKDLLHHEVRRNLLTSAVLMALSAPLALALLVAKLFAPAGSGRTFANLARQFDIPLATRAQFSAPADSPPATPEAPRLGFTDEEQATRVEAFLRTIGLTNNFAPFVVIMGHGSDSQNNPHHSAYQCGACSGRNGGPNARVFSAMANRPEIRARLRERGIEIPDDTRFTGASHNTCDETLHWFDEDQVPEAGRTAYQTVKQAIYHATLDSAHERCRRLASAPHDADRETALHHIIGRGYDISQARPELGHATNAAAFIGRRALSRGAFFDRRVFLISYDPTQDPAGKIVEAILLAAGPVGAGINLEYYFSTVNNERYGCGTKTVHNITGFFGVMEGAGSDLRTGLPRQMIEIHEAMRLQVLVEAKTDILTAIYQRQPPLQELVGNGWLLLSAKDPDSAQIHVFDPARGWLPWAGGQKPLTTVKRSPEWYRGHQEPLLPVLVEAGELRL